MRDDGTRVWAGGDVYARQAHRFSEKGKHVYREIAGGAVRHVAGKSDRAVVGGMLDAQNARSGSEIDEGSSEDAGLHLAL